MDPFEALVAIFAITFGVGFVAYLFGKTVGLIQTWIESRSGGKVNRQLEDRINRLEASAERAEKRLQNLETIIVDNDLSLPESSGYDQDKEQRNEADPTQPLTNRLRSK